MAEDGADVAERLVGLAAGALGEAGELEQQHVPRHPALLQRAQERRRVTDGQDGQVVDVAGRQEGDIPNGLAPRLLVPDVDQPGDPELVGDHAELVAPGLLLHRHGDVATVRQLFPVTA